MIVDGKAFFKEKLNVRSLAYNEWQCVYSLTVKLFLEGKILIRLIDTFVPNFSLAENVFSFRLELKPILLII